MTANCGFNFRNFIKNSYETTMLKQKYSTKIHKNPVFEQSNKAAGSYIWQLKRQKYSDEKDYTTFNNYFYNSLIRL